MTSDNRLEPTFNLSPLIRRDYITGIVYPTYQASTRWGGREMRVRKTKQDIKGRKKITNTRTTRTLRREQSNQPVNDQVKRRELHYTEGYVYAVIGGACCCGCANCCCCGGYVAPPCGTPPPCGKPPAPKSASETVVNQIRPWPLLTAMMAKTSKTTQYPIRSNHVRKDKASAAWY